MLLFVDIRMKVLWFSNTSSLASKILKMNEVNGGWISSLEIQLCKYTDIELTIVFDCSNKEIKTIKKINGFNTQYVLIPTYRNRFLSVFYRLFWINDDKKILKSYLKIIDQLQPDIIHFFGSEHRYGTIIPYLNCPYVLQLQGIMNVITNKWFSSGISNIHIFLFTKFWKLLLRKGLLYKYKQFKDAAKREEYIFNVCKNYIGRTDFDRRIVSIFSKDYQYFHCEEILRDEFYEVEWKKKRNNTFNILSVFQGDIYKGLETICQSAYLIKDKTNIPFEWKIIGLEINSDITFLFRKKFNFNYSELNIQFLGIKETDFIIDSFLKTDLFVHPSHIENSSNALCEAMLIGVPIISTYAGGTSSIINNGKEGILIQDGDPYVLAGAIKEVFEKKEKAYEMGKEARKRAIERHNKFRIGKQTYEIYKKLIKNKN